MTKIDKMLLEMESYCNDKGYDFFSNEDLVAIVFNDEDSEFNCVRGLSAFLTKQGYEEEFLRVDLIYNDGYLLMFLQEAA